MTTRHHPSDGGLALQEFASVYSSTREGHVYNAGSKAFAAVLNKLFFRVMSVANSAKLIENSANLGHGAVLVTLFGATAVVTARDLHGNDAKADFVSNKLRGFLGKRHCRSARAGRAGFRGALR